MAIHHDLLGSNQKHNGIKELLAFNCWLFHSGSLALLVSEVYSYPNLSAPSPRTPDGKPDLSGLWEPELKGRIGEGSIAIAAGDDPVTPEFINIGSRLEGGLPYQPWAAQLARKRTREEHGASDPLGNGFPVGIVRLHSYATPRKMIQNPGLLVILYELNSTFRQIFTDGRPLSADPNPTWNGYSSGKWEGDVLVVKTNGF
jgi:hypothetical protein